MVEEIRHGGILREIRENSQKIFEEILSKNGQVMSLMLSYIDGRLLAYTSAPLEENSSRRLDADISREDENFESCARATVYTVSSHILKRLQENGVKHIMISGSPTSIFIKDVGRHGVLSAVVKGKISASKIEKILNPHLKHIGNIVNSLSEYLENIYAKPL
jgi:predicted regulator of Ras-like GTPase activity (Roadblock/LC7/MglB family)